MSTIYKSLNHMWAYKMVECKHVYYTLRGRTKRRNVNMFIINYVGVQKDGM